MGQLIYVMQFKGTAAPVAGSSTMLKAMTTAQSATISTVVGPEGVSGALQPAAGGNAIFESEVTFTGETSFQESGTITFGDHGHRLRFSTVGQGVIGDSADPQLKHGSVIWRVEEGEGQFEGARGLITSNFTVSNAGEVTDNHFGVIFVK
jgi:hypothetical protein